MFSDASVVIDGSIIFAVFLAFFAGLVSFFSPCVLPLLPGYLAVLGNSSADSSNEGLANKRSSVFLASLIFVSGFSAVFLILMLLANSLGVWIFVNAGLLTRMFGLVIICLGIVFLGGFGFLQVPQKFLTISRSKTSPFILGVAFALGWTPCIGPTLGLIMFLGVEQETAVRAGILGIFYCIGLGLPFLLGGLGLSWFTSLRNFAVKNVRIINLFGGWLLIFIGILMVSGFWEKLMLFFQTFVTNFEVAL